VIPEKRAAPVLAGAVALVALIAVASMRLNPSDKPELIGRSSPLTSDEGLQVEAAISPNGRLVAFAAGNANHLRIRVQRINGGASWPLSRDSTDVELMPRWSPDNDQILFLSRNNAYVAPTLGGSPRLVARGKNDDGMVRSACWSPTGDSIAIVRNDSLMVQPLRGGGARFVSTGAQLHSCVWAPNGKWIACVSGNWIAFTPGPLFGNDAPSSVILFPASGGKGTMLTDSNFENESPAWSEDGKFLWMLSNRDGVGGEAYAIPIGDDGRGRGAFVKIGVKAESISIGAGRIAYSVPSKKANIWSIPIPQNSTVSVAAATPITTGNQVIELISVSPDGKWLIYDSNLRGNSDIFRIPVDGGEAEPLTDDVRQEFAAEVSPDGGEIAWQRWVGGERHLFVKKLDSDFAEEILPVPGDQGVPRWSADGRSIVAWSHNTERGAIFVTRRERSGKWSRPRWRLDFGQVPIWIANDREIAFVRLDGSVQSVPADSGAVRTLYSPRPGSSDPVVTFIVPAKDSSTLWMLGQSGADQGIWALSLLTGRTRLLVKLDDPVGKSIGPAFTADGSRFYFALNERFSNVRWAELTAR
jgi:Tol biopolymer transport system component